MRLQELCGPLMLYYNLNFHLPEKLEDFAAGSGSEHLNRFRLPVSGLPYVYTPQGAPSPQPGWFVIVADKTPVQPGGSLGNCDQGRRSRALRLSRTLSFSIEGPAPKPVIVSNFHHCRGRR